MPASTAPFRHHRLDTPIWARLNPYLYWGYRASPATVVDILKSHFFLHNETMNIWSAIVLMAVNAYMATSAVMEFRALKAPSILVFLFTLHGVCRVLCWLGSWIMHAWKPISETVSWYGNRADYLGIYVAFVGMGTNGTWLALECAFTHSYLSQVVPARSVAVVLGATAAIFGFAASFIPAYNGSSFKSRVLRVAVFAVVLIVYSVPLLVLLAHNQWVDASAVAPFHRHDRPHLFRNLAGCCVSMVFGAFFFLTCYPERFLFTKALYGRDEVRVEGIAGKDAAATAAVGRTARSSSAPRRRSVGEAANPGGKSFSRRRFPAAASLGRKVATFLVVYIFPSHSLWHWMCLVFDIFIFRYCHDEAMLLIRTNFSCRL